MSAEYPQLPRHQKLALFDTEYKNFRGVYQLQHLPPIDSQVELCFQQALALDNPDIEYKKNADSNKKIYQLYKKAADRHHWQAIHNLAAFILRHQDELQKTEEDAINLVEEAMLLGIPDAYYLMGTYHADGRIEGGDENSANAFFLKAANLGSPAAQSNLGAKLVADYSDSETEESLESIQVGMRMLECAYAQGYGYAAYELASIYEAKRTAESNAKAIQILHNGVKYGSSICAESLYSAFKDGFITPLGVDQSRSRRYLIISDLLGWYKERINLPNLDKVLPLPPAKLPVWDGHPDTLFNAAKAVVPVNNTKAKPTRGSKLEGRAHIPQGYAVNREPTGQPFYENTRVPKSAYWLPVLQLSQLSGGQWANEPYYRFNAEQVPLFFKEGEAFSIDDPRLDAGSPRLLWFYLGVAQAIPEAEPGLLDLLAKYGQARAVDFSAEKLTCTGEQTCPKTGIWQATAEAEHPLAVIYNAWDRQSFVEENQPFPEPQESGLDIKAEQVSWSYIGQQNADKGETGIKEITL